MSQNDFNIANQGFPATRADINSALQALASNSAGTAEPSTTYAYQFWYDETNELLKMRNSDNDAWITIAAFDQTNDEWEVRSAVVQAVDAAGVTIKTDDGVARVTIADDGYVGIGTTNPTDLLDVVEDDGVNSAIIRVRQSTASLSAQVRFGDDTNDNGGLIIKGGSTWSSYGGNNSFNFWNNRNGPMVFGTNDTERMRIDSSGNVGIGTNNPAAKLNIGASGVFRMQTGSVTMDCTPTPGAIDGFVWNLSGGYYDWSIGGTSYTRIDNSGNFMVGRTNTDFTSNSYSGALFLPTQGLALSKTASPNLGACLYMNRATVGDGALVEFAENAVLEGSISVSGSTVSYNGGHLARWSQTADNTRIDGLLKGTVMTNLDQMAVWSHETTYWTEEDELPEGVAIGDVKREAFIEDNEQLNCMAVSSVEGDPNVAGVFVNWDDDDDMNIAMTGDMIIRIAQGTTVQRGDLLMSAGDGTAKPQGDDIVRSKTIAKVTSTHVTCTYDDGSYCVPCVLMAC